MQWRRWYPTGARLPDSRVVIVDGRYYDDAAPGQWPSTAEVWDPSTPDSAVNMTVTRTHPAAYLQYQGLQWYPFIMTLPKGHLLWFGQKGGVITKYKDNFDPIAGSNFSKPVGSMEHMYPFTGAVTLLALKPENNYQPSMVIFGGAPRYGKTYAVNSSVYTPASNLAYRIAFTYCADGVTYCMPAGDAKWQTETMAVGRFDYPRVSGDAIPLPNGRVIVLNGMKNGQAGPWTAGYPQLTAIMYDPDLPLGSRFTAVAARTNIMRPYHGCACLVIDGTVLVIGSDASFADLPGAGAGSGVSLPPTREDNRAEILTPPDLVNLGPLGRPSITSVAGVALANGTAPPRIAMGSTFTVYYGYGGSITGAVFQSPCVQTHSVTKGNRLVFLVITARGTDASGQWLDLVAPPADDGIHSGIALPGAQMLFLLGEAPKKAWSVGAWLTLARPSPVLRLKFPTTAVLWRDEFTTLDDTSWTPLLGNGKDFGIPGWANGELQCYTGSSANVGVVDAPGCTNGCLYITAVQHASPVTCPNPRTGDTTTNYTSAKLVTKQKRNFMWSGTYNNSQPILIEARMRLNTAVAKGMWMTFWGLPASNNTWCQACGDFGGWCASGDIDFVHHLGTEAAFPSKVWENGNNTNGQACNSNTGYANVTDANAAADWHTFTTIWDSTYFRFMLDGKPYHEVRQWKSAGSSLPGAPYIRPFHLLLQLAVGAQGGKEIDPGSHTMYVDYIKVEQLQCTKSEAGLCGDGIDNDCNGFADNQDPACAA